MSKDYFLKCRVTKEQFIRIQEVCRLEEISVSDLLREYILMEIDRSNNED